MLQFQNISFLFGLLVFVPLVALFIYVLRWKRKVKKELGDEELINQLTNNYAPKNFNLKFLLQALAVLLCVIGAANLREPEGGAQSKKTGIDVMVALDVSNSMLAQDIAPNRLERAKQLINKIIDQLGDNRMGLVLFAGKSYLQMPLTPDLAAAKMYVSNASPGAVTMQGTVVADALKTCNASLDTKEKKYKAVVLISDGETHDEKTEEAVKLLQENGVIVYTVGIGSPGGSPIYEPGTTDYKKDADGNTVISKLNEQELQTIATETSGTYYLFTNADDIASNILFQLSKMDKKAIAGGFNKNYTSYFQIFIALAILLLLLEVIIPEKKNEVALMKFLLTILFQILLLKGIAQKNQPHVFQGNQFYKQKDYANAAAEYKKALEKNDKNTEAKYNLGNSLYLMKKSDEALHAYEGAFETGNDKTMKAKAGYNKGVVLTRQKKLEESIDAYKQSLRLNSEDSEVRENLQKALNELKKKQDQNQQNKNNKNNQQNKNQEQDQPQNKSKLNQKQAEKMLNALRQQEKKLQQSVQNKNNKNGGVLLKDW